MTALRLGERRGSLGATPRCAPDWPNAYVQAGGDNEKAARILGVTVGSARLAKRRHLDASEIDHRQKAS